jgi:hypothetical protein
MADPRRDADKACRNGATCYVMPAVLAMIMAFVALFVAPFAGEDAVVAEEASTSPVAFRD